jgi:cytochrome c5
MARWLLIVGICVAVGIAALVVIDGDPKGALRGYVGAESPVLASIDTEGLSDADYGAAYFSYGDFSALSSDTLRVSATPWVITASLLALQEADGDPGKVSSDLLLKAYHRYGFNIPDEIANWPAGLSQPNPDLPLGLNVGQAGRWMPPIAVSVANVGCPACHSGLVYGADGMPDTRRAWIGAANSSINLEGYTNAVFSAMRTYGGDDARLWQAVDTLFPDLGLRERWTLKLVVMPALRARVQELDATLGRALPFSGGLPGATNGLDALKNRLGLLPEGKLVARSAFNSVPDLGGRLWRNTLLNTGGYAIPGIETTKATTLENIDDAHMDALGAIVTFFTVPSMGVSLDAAEANIPTAQRLMRWLRAYAPQPYPRPIDATLAARGHGIYAATCATCHGSLSSSLTQPQLESFPNWSGDVGTDKLRIELFDEATIAAVNGSQFGKYIAARPAQGYAAPPLVGLWSSAPYLHNGSIPTLYHLMHPGARPAKFQVGGHALDLERVGIAGVAAGDGSWTYPATYQPWSEPVLIDTTLPGLSNSGHDQPFAGMSEADKAALLEYLKLL